MLSRLQNAGLIARERDPDDRRVTRVTLTPAGREAAARGDVQLKAFNQRLARGFTPQELATVQRFLSSVIERVDAGEL